MAALPQALEDIGSSVGIILDNENAHWALLTPSRLQISSKRRRCASRQLPGYETVYFGKSPPTPTLLRFSHAFDGPTVPHPFWLENLHAAPAPPRLLPSRLGAVGTARHR